MEWDRLMAHAWHAAAFGRVTRMPSLESVLSRHSDARQTKPLTSAEYRNLAERINAAFGGVDLRKPH